MNRIQTAFLTFASAAILSTPVAAEVELSLYLGVQDAPASRVEGNDGDSAFDFTTDWEGKSGEMPPYYGFRATWWRSERVGYGLEVNHVKVYAPDEDRAANGFGDLELTDGLNVITANLFYRWPDQWAGGRLTPYVGGGVGFAMPHVDVSRGDSDTFGYQVSGPAVSWVGGVSWAMSDHWAVFGEYKGTYSSNDIDLDGGGWLETDIVTNAFSVGVSYSF